MTGAVTINASRALSVLQTDRADDDAPQGTQIPVVAGAIAGPLSADSRPVRSPAAAKKAVAAAGSVTAAVTWSKCFGAVLTSAVRWPIANSLVPPGRKPPLWRCWRMQIQVVCCHPSPTVTTTRSSAPSSARSSKNGHGVVATDLYREGFAPAMTVRGAAHLH